MKILVLGADGYLGWPTVNYLESKGHELFAMDNFRKRRMSRPLTQPLSTGILEADVLSPGTVEAIANIRPDAIVHYAEIPSAPFSMANRRDSVETMRNNVLGTLNILWAIKGTDTHLVKLGTMGEYGTPNIDIEEGWLEIHHKGRIDTTLYPKKPPSFYHASKVADSTNIEFACRAWGIRATDLNQGIVYGVRTDECPETTFHYDAVWGTALNRFVTQAVAGEPLTVYGAGNQTRGWLNILDTLRCVELAIENPPDRGEFRVFNQFTEQFSVAELAYEVSQVAGAKIGRLPNPRVEQEQHYYHASNEGFRRLGLEPHLLTAHVIREMLHYVEKHKDKIDKSILVPDINWR